MSALQASCLPCKRIFPSVILPCKCIYLTTTCLYYYYTTIFLPIGVATGACCLTPIALLLCWLVILLLVLLYSIVLSEGLPARGAPVGCTPVS